MLRPQFTKTILAVSSRAGPASGNDKEAVVPGIRLILPYKNKSCRIIIRSYTARSYNESESVNSYATKRNPKIKSRTTRRSRAEYSDSDELEVQPTDSRVYNSDDLDDDDPPDSSKGTEKAQRRVSSKTRPPRKKRKVADASQSELELEEGQEVAGIVVQDGSPGRTAWANTFEFLGIRDEEPISLLGLQPLMQKRNCICIVPLSIYEQTSRSFLPKRTHYHVTQSLPGVHVG